MSPIATVIAKFEIHAQDKPLDQIASNLEWVGYYVTVDLS